mmetsp:Transcript_28146/g.89968  ORF Transcript_28146/g.89968 Transcript_28146/m.89968 type:complete len:282 (-) Transcript_28146:182-1027(-)
MRNASTQSDKKPPLQTLSLTLSLGQGRVPRLLPVELPDARDERRGDGEPHRRRRDDPARRRQHVGEDADEHVDAREHDPDEASAGAEALLHGVEVVPGVADGEVRVEREERRRHEAAAARVPDHDAGDAAQHADRRPHDGEGDARRRPRRHRPLRLVRLAALRPRRIERREPARLLRDEEEPAGGGDRGEPRVHCGEHLRCRVHDTLRKDLHHDELRKNAQVRALNLPPVRLARIRSRRRGRGRRLGGLAGSHGGGGGLLRRLGTLGIVGGGAEPPCGRAR